MDTHLKSEMPPIKHKNCSITISENSLLKIYSEKEHPSDPSFQLRFLGKVQMKGKHHIIRIHECFDGDLPEIAAHKSSTLPEFETAVQNYYSRKFPAAEEVLRQVSERNPHDKVIHHFLEKNHSVNIRWRN